MTEERQMGKYTQKTPRYSVKRVLPRRPPFDRLIAQTRRDESTGCLIFTGSKNSAGYGGIRIPEVGRILAHRFAYEHVHGPIPAEKQIDHLCRTRACVEPSHLEAVTPRENTLRGIAPTAINAQKTHCKWGHEFNAANTRVIASGGRVCKECSRRRFREWRERQRAKRGSNR